MSAHDPLPSASLDLDPQETREWLDALSGVIETEGRNRAHDLLETVLDHARQAGMRIVGPNNEAPIMNIIRHATAKLRVLNSRISSTGCG